MEKNYDYVISSKKNDYIYVKDCNDFLNWFLKVKPINKEILFYETTGDVVNLYDFLKYYYDVKKDFVLFMEKYNDDFSKEDNVFLKEAFDYFVLSNSGGKYLRATLLSIGFHMFADGEDYLPLSMALELFQTSILIHDDIIDSAVKRRGIDTIVQRYKNNYKKNVISGNNFRKKRNNISNSMALCLGDIGFYYANQLIVDNYGSHKNFSKVFKYFNDMAIKTCKGEMIDVILPFYEEFYGNTENIDDSIINIYELKTAWYSVVGPLVLGAILAGADDVSIKKLEDCFLKIGVAFQIKDDLLGIYGNEKVIGKSVSSDISEFKQTILYAYTKKTKYYKKLLKYYGRKLSASELKEVQKIFEISGAKEYSNKIMEDMFDEGIHDILELDFISECYRKVLLGFVEFLKVRNK